jgi:hypothetical protein
MSYEISYRRQAFVLPTGATGHYDDLFFLLEETGSNNCYDPDSKRRARNWCCTAAGAKWECLAEVTRMAAACCGGSLVLYGRRGTAPEQYIRAWRKAMAAGVPLAEAPRQGFCLQLFTRIPDMDKAKSQYALDHLTDQTWVPPHRDSDPFNGQGYTEWRFDARKPDQVKLWLETRPSGRGFHSVEVYGPTR